MTSEPPAPKGERPARRGRSSGRWELFNAEAAYADSLFRTAIGELEPELDEATKREGAVLALIERSRVRQRSEGEIFCRGA